MYMYNIHTDYGKLYIHMCMFVMHTLHVYIHVHRHTWHHRSRDMRKQLQNLQVMGYKAGTYIHCTCIHVHVVHMYLTHCACIVSTTLPYLHLSGVLFTCHLLLPDTCYCLALCHYKMRQYSSALKYISEVIERGIKDHPELSIGMQTEGIDIRSVGNSMVHSAICTCIRMCYMHVHVYTLHMQ